MGVVLVWRMAGQAGIVVVVVRYPPFPPSPLAMHRIYVAERVFSFVPRGS